MAKNTFLGGIAYRKYTAGYTCEFCRKPVIWESSVKSHAGKVVTHKTTTRVNLAEGTNKFFLEAQAMAGLDAECAKLTTDWEKGIYPSGVEANCPHCKKMQHWAGYYTFVPDEETAKKIPQQKVSFGWAFGMLGVGFFVGLVIAVIVTLIMRTAANWNTVNLICFGIIPVTLFIVFLFLGPVINRRNEQKKRDEKKQFDNMELTYPEILSWGESGSYTSG